MYRYWAFMISDFLYGKYLTPNFDQQLKFLSGNHHIYTIMALKNVFSLTFSTLSSDYSHAEYDVDRVMVENVMASGLSTTQLEVTWSLPEYGCDAVGYRIYYAKENSTDDIERSEYQILYAGFSLHTSL